MQQGAIWDICCHGNFLFLFVVENSSDEKKKSEKIIWKNEKAVVRTGYYNWQGPIILKEKSNRGAKNCLMVSKIQKPINRKANNNVLRTV